MKQAWSMLGIDVAGAGACVLFLGMGAWTALPQKQSAKRENLAAEIVAAKNDLNSLRLELEKQKERGDRGRKELSAAGRMPDQAPQEIHLQTLSGLAAQNNLVVMRQLPLPPREYPGLLEQRFAFEVTGTVADLVRFFRAIESSPAWTDISYLKIDRGKEMASLHARNALLTFSAFSTARVPNDANTKQRGG